MSCITDVFSAVSYVFSSVMNIFFTISYIFLAINAVIRLATLGIGIIYTGKCKEKKPVSNRAFIDLLVFIHYVFRAIKINYKRIDRTCFSGFNGHKKTFRNWKVFLRL